MASVTKRKVEVNTKRLTLRPMTETEMETLIAGEQDAHLKQAYEQMLRGCRENPEQWAFYACWQIAVKDGTPVGDLCFKGAPKDGATEIGYGILPAYQGNGYATEAVAAAMEWAFGKVSELYYILAEAEESNAPSRRVLEKLGFVSIGQGSEGTLYEKERPNGNLMSMYLCLGMSVGVCIGVSTDHLAMGISLGMCLGACLGAILESSDKKKRQAAKAARKTAEDTSRQ